MAQPGHHRRRLAAEGHLRGGRHVERYQLILFDTGGRRGSLVTQAMYASDVAYAPVAPRSRRRSQGAGSSVPSAHGAALLPRASLGRRRAVGL